jgi:aspartyl protease family protein
MDGDSFARLAYLALLLVAVGGYLVVELRRRPGKTAQQAAIWGLIFLGAIGAAGIWGDIRQSVLPRQQVGIGGRIEVPISRDGHFYLIAELNGVPVRFAVDTGASEIVLSARDATRIGLDPSRLAYIGRARTANGVVETAPVRIDRFVLGELRDDNVPAVVNRGEMDGSLLGMSYLARFSRMEITPNRLVLER